MVVLCSVFDINQELIDVILEMYAKYGDIYILPITLSDRNLFKIKEFCRIIDMAFNGLYGIKTKIIGEICFTEIWYKEFEFFMNNKSNKLLICGDNKYHNNELPRKGYDISFLNSSTQNSKSVLKVLLTGVESCGKTTLSLMLSKKFNTLNTYEFGRNYSKEQLNGNDNSYDMKDFFDIAFHQQELEKSVIQNAKDVVFFDTDVILTQFYCEVFCGEKDEGINYLIKRSSYDLILFLNPEIEWIQDDVRFMNSYEIRMNYSDSLYNLYKEYGFESKIRMIGGDFSQRYNKCIQYVLEILKSKNRGNDSE